MSMHRDDYRAKGTRLVDWAHEHPIVVAIFATAAITAFLMWRYGG